MQQHPIPQNVTGYKFHLVGDMTIKQFAELAAGIVLAWLTFSSQLNFIFKWTLGPLAAFMGFALAFVPVEDRPLDQWIINFFKSIYNPTQYLFRSEPKSLDIFTPPKSRPTEAKFQLADPAKLEDYLQSLPPTQTTAFDQAESKYLDHIGNLFGALGSKVKKHKEEDSPPPVLDSSSVKGIRVRKLNHPQMCLLPHATSIQPPPDLAQAAIPTPQPAKPKVKIPPPPPINSLGANAPKSNKLNSKIYPANAGQPKATPQPASETTFAKNVIMPQLPEKPNLLSGITLDKQGKIIPSVILEIRDSKNNPVRAFKSNKLGQFFISTPLLDGLYKLEAEHSDHRFDIMKLEAKGEIIPPLKIQAS